MESVSTTSTDTALLPYPVCGDILQVPGLLKKHGVCVIPDVFTSSECDAWMTDITRCMEVLSGGKIDRNKPGKWSSEHLPPVTRYGLYQNLLNNLEPVWQIRRDPRWRDIFKVAAASYNNYIPISLLYAFINILN